jgi:hypothetical protein
MIMVISPALQLISVATRKFARRIKIKKMTGRKFKTQQTLFLPLLPSRCTIESLELQNTANKI